MLEIIKKKNDLIIFKPQVFEDDRGYFFESFNEKEFKDKIADVDFVQDNQSYSKYGTVRGLHFQKPPYDQAKLVRIVKGAVLDVVVDLRNDSEHFGEFEMVYLSEQNNYQFYIPRGFAHGFLTLAPNTIFQYKCNNYYNSESDSGINILSDFHNGKIPISFFIDKYNIIQSVKDKGLTYFDNSMKYF